MGDAVKEAFKNAFKDIGPGTEALTKLIIIIIVIAAIWIITQLVRRILNKFSENYSAKRIQIKTFIPIINICINLFALYIILFHLIGIKGNDLLTFGISAGIAIGFGGQDLIANILGGLIIIFSRPFNIGDKINVGEYYGEVTDINLLKVVIVTPDDSAINIPTKTFLSSSISNSNSGELNCQVVTEMCLPGNIDMQEVKRIAKEAVLSSPYTYLKKPVTIIFRDDFKETSLIKLKIKAYVYDHRNEFKFSSDIYERIKKYFKEKNIVLPDFYRMP